jgi:hypothetical protein
MLDDIDNSFTKGKTAPESFIVASDDNPPEILVVLARMSRSSADFDSLLRQASKAIGNADSPLKEEIRFLEWEKTQSMGLPQARLKFAFTSLGNFEMDSQTTELVVRSIAEIFEHGGEIGASYLQSLLLWSGVFGVEPNRPRAEAIWRTISLQDLQRFPVVKSTQLLSAQTEFIHKKWEVAQNEEEAARAIALLVERTQPDIHLTAVLLKQLYLMPSSRFNAIKEIPKYLPDFMKALRERRQESLLQAVITKVDIEWPEGTDPAIRNAISRYRSRYGAFGYP